MSMTRRLLASWRAPRAVMRDLLSAGHREDRAFAMLFVACLLIFVAQMPGLARQAHLDPSVPLDARIGGALMGTVFLVPLFAYLIGGITHVVAKLMGGQGTFFTARLALFWSLLAVSPLMLMQGLVAGFIGSGAQATATGLLVMCGFLYQWANCLIVAEGRDTVTA